MHRELHRSGRAGWLRAAVLGADDGIVSTASLVIGVAAAAASRNAVLLAGVAGLVAGATSMAAGEYVSVSSQRDAEQADISREREELAADPAFEQAELTDIYVRRELDQGRCCIWTIRGRLKLGPLSLDQIAKARSSNATVSRWLAATSTASS